MLTAPTLWETFEYDISQIALQKDSAVNMESSKRKISSK